ncbi:MAG: chorismate-binding protein [Actinomycetaceae bacterium]|nr:chorismate-binding protein [Actinomycetaceae bacterium]
MQSLSFETTQDLADWEPVRSLLQSVRITRESQRRGFEELLLRVGSSDTISSWSGPALAGDAQPTIVGTGVALAIVAKEDASLALVDPNFQELSRALLPNPRPENPGKVQNQPHMKRAGAAWLRLVSSCEGVPGARDFLARTGLVAPLGLMSFGFAPTTPGVLILPRVTWVSTEDSTWRIEVGDAALGLSEAEEACPHLTDPENWYLDPGTMSRTAWKRAVAAVIEELRKGDTHKAVMARDITARADDPIDLRAVLRALAKAYPTCWKFSVAGMTGASPEMLASVREGVVKSRVLAGTCAPGQGEELWDSAKDRQEHAFAVQSVVDALQPMASDLDAPAEPFLLDLPNVTHLASDVSAHLDLIEPGLAPVCEVVRSLHPTAAVCGTPTQAAFELLSVHELTDRGRYSGPVGWIDGGGEGACAIALRCGQVLPDRRSIRVFAGGGIMPDSQPEVELQETQAKMMPVLQAIGLEK